MSRSRADSSLADAHVWLGTPTPSAGRIASIAADHIDADMIRNFGELPHPEDLLFPGPMIFSEQVADLSAVVALHWTNGVTDNICSYANDSPTARGGMHVEGFSRALAGVIRTYASSSQPVDSTTDSLFGEDIREGLMAIIRTHCDDPWFEPLHDNGINGRKLNTLKMREFVYWATSTHLTSWLDEHPREATLIVNKSISAAHDRVRARAQWDQRQGS
jgi:DNA gyrase subunit B